MESLHLEATKNTLQDVPKRGNINSEEYLIIPRSVGAAFSNHEVVDRETGKVYRFVAGPTRYHIERFAGKGGRKPLRPEVAEAMAKRLGCEPREVSHCKAVCLLDVDGEEVPAEVHWFQSPNNKCSFFVKKWVIE